MKKTNILDVINKSLELRQKFRVDAFSPIEIFSIVQRIPNLTLIMYPLGDNISGYCIKRNNLAIIVINSEMTLGRQRYSLAHELYHVYYDEKMSTFVCSNFNNKSQNEIDADMFASYFLMPQTAFNDLKITKPITIEKVVILEQYYKTSRKATLFRLLNEKLITQSQFEDYSKNVKLSAKKMGYDSSLYEPSPEAEKYFVYGKYIKDVELLHEKGKISEGKYEEYLLSAFRDDIVYGLDGGEIID